MKKRDQKRAFYVFFCSFLIVNCSLFFACFSPFTESEEAGMAVISIKLGGGTARGVGFGGAVDDTIFTLTYSLTLLDESQLEQEIQVNPSTGYGTVKVSPGTYSINVAAFVNGWDYAWGSEGPFTVSAGETKSVDIQMERLSSAVALSLPRDEVLSLHNIAGITPVGQTIDIYNFTDADPVYITVDASDAPDFSCSTNAFSITRDSAYPFTITPIPNIADTYVGALILTWSGGAVILDLELTVVDL
jgi:hypothetical protein